MPVSHGFLPEISRQEIYGKIEEASSAAVLRENAVGRASQSFVALIVINNKSQRNKERAARVLCHVRQFLITRL